MFSLVGTPFLLASKAKQHQTLAIAVGPLLHLRRNQDLTEQLTKLLLALHLRKLHVAGSSPQKNHLALSADGASEARLASTCWWTTRLHRVGKGLPVGGWVGGWVGGRAGG